MDDLTAFLENPKTTLKQLQAYASEKGIVLNGASKKADIAAAIKAAKNALPSPSETLTLTRVLLVSRKLMKGADVKAVQEALIAKGYHVGANSVDGIYTASTARAVRDFQAASGLIVNGEVAKQTAEALGANWQGR